MGTGGGANIPDAIIDPNISDISDSLLVEIPGANDSDGMATFPQSGDSFQLGSVEIEIEQPLSLHQSAQANSNQQELEHSHSVPEPAARREVIEPDAPFQSGPITTDIEVCDTSRPRQPQSSLQYEQTNSNQQVSQSELTCQILMWNPGNESVPNDFIDILNDEESESDEEIVEEEIEQEGDLAAQIDLLNLLSGSNIFVVQSAGTLAPTARPEPISDVVASDTDEEEEQADELVSWASSRVFSIILILPITHRS
ncbi:uncharacterized protein LOC113229410 [Hyposmocoma kahamanoa]|uniref:uncharacterized protein LOC113229410 n=1 Tax=Hyposmocoma kahamanoa TaxID=1477025 RepID=UPI000E6DA4B9|nr:uncharacterized protein LOC113229410 [Hyposmocoma kahamanoa]